METLNVLALNLVLLMFYLVTIWLLNRFLIYGRFRARVKDSENLKNRIPLLVSGNLCLLIGLLIGFKSIYAYIMYEVSSNFSLGLVLGYASIVLIINATVIGIAYVISLVISRFFFNNLVPHLKELLWPFVSAIILLLLIEQYNAYISENSFSIL